MYNGYQIVVNTAAGRRRYMQYLIPYILACPIVDRYDIWINTHNCADIEFFKQIAAIYPQVNLVWQPDGIVNGNASINAFYKKCIEPHTVYFKLDDDIVWMETDAIEKMVKFRIDNPEYFLVSPLVINNSLSTYLLQTSGKIQLKEYCNADSSHQILWKSGRFSKDLHNWFISNYLSTSKWPELHLGHKIMGMTRFSINAILWFGDEMAKFKGIVPGDDEEFMSCIYPTSQGMANAWNGDTIMAHFAFFTQRAHLDAANILERYGVECHKQWYSNEVLAKIDKNIQTILSNIEQNEQTLKAKPSPYKSLPKQVPLRSKIKKFIPSIILQLRDLHRSKSNEIGYIIK